MTTRGKAAAGSVGLRPKKAAKILAVVAALAALAVPARAASTSTIFTTQISTYQAGVSHPIEVGVKFRSDSAGTVIGVRFYKFSSLNSGTHIGDLWSASGALLASATFAGESASGWQTVLFSTPVAIQPNDTYIASYHTTTQYSVSRNYFTGSGVDNAPLHALQSGVSGVNGVYAYGTGPTFPINGVADSNWWADVIFQPALSQPPPAITAISPAATTAGSGPFTLSVFGQDFSTSSVVRWNGSDRGTTFVSVSTLTASIMASDVQSSGTASVTVFDPGGGASNAVSFTVEPSSIVPTTAQWTQTGPLAYSHASQPAARLLDGRIFIPGGNGESQIPSEIYDPGGDQWSVAGSAQPWFDRSATTLADGRVLLVGGVETECCSASAELFTPATTGYALTGSLNQPRAEQSATRLADGRVLVAGGQEPGQDAIAHASAEIFDPALGSWSLTGSMTTGRYRHGAILLAHGRVLVAGGLHRFYMGLTAVSEVTAAVEIYDPGSGTWSAANSMSTPRQLPAIARLQDGRVLVAGGASQDNAGIPAGPLASAAIFDPASGQWTSAASMAAARVGATATVLPDGSVLVAGGGTNSAERYDPVSGTWSSAGGMHFSRTEHRAEILKTGQVLVVDGEDAFGTQSTAERYNPGPFLAALSPSSTTAGGPAFSLAVTGLVFSTSSVVLWNGSPRATTFISASTLTAAIPASDIAAAGTAQVSVSDPGGLSKSLPFAINAAATTTSTTTIFTTQAPTNAAGASSPIEVGVKFQSESAGNVVGVRFYKLNILNSGTHLGELWSASGALLASATFTGETASGWQTVMFSAPVAIQANTTYVASYHTTTQYSVTRNYFTSAGVDNAPLHALKSGVSGVNGVYAYGSGPTFPVNGVSDSNWWADVIFQSTASVAQPPSIASIEPSSATAGGPGFTLSVLGQRFSTSSVVQWNGAARATSFVSETALSAAIPASDIASSGTAQISVSDPAGGSNAALFTINPAPPAGSTTTIVSLTFDDGTSSHTVAQQILDAHGLKGTFYVNSGRVGADGYLNLSQIRDLGSDGHEIAGHTIDHPDLTTLVSSAVAHEVCDDRTQLETWGFKPLSFAYPFGATNAGVASTVQSCGYQSARGIGGIACPGCPAAETVPPAHVYNIATPDSIKSTTTLAQIESYVTSAEQSGGGWVVLVMHKIEDNPNETFSISPATLSSLIDWLSPRASSGTVVKRVGDVIGSPVAAPAPYLASISPQSAQAGGSAFTMTAFGLGFSTASVVRWNGAARPTTFVSASTITAAIPASDLAAGATIQVSIADPGGLSNSLPFVVNPGPVSASTTTIFTTQVPTNGAAASSAIEVGVKFKSDSAGDVVGVRFYKLNSLNSGTHIGDLWSGSGALLASATFTGETSSGWQTVLFSAPVHIQANTTYVASYHTTTHYSVTRNFFTSGGVDNAPLHALQTGVSGVNGVYAYGSGPTFPVNGVSDSNWWADVIFRSTAGVTQQPPAIASLSPSSATAGDPGFTLSVFGQRFSTASVVQWNGSPRATGFISAEMLTATIPSSDVASPGTAQVSVADPAGASNAVAFAINPAGGVSSSTTTIFTTQTPTNATAASSPIEVGVKFQSDSAGTVVAVRFYKLSSANSGTHLGELWSASGTLLASATFSGETASGWQTVFFSSPVTIQPTPPTSPPTTPRRSTPSRATTSPTPPWTTPRSMP